MLLAGAFVGILAAILSARPDVPVGIIMLALMGLLAGQMMYRWKMDLILVTVITVAVTIAAMALGPWGQTKNSRRTVAVFSDRASAVRMGTLPWYSFR